MGKVCEHLFDSLEINGVILLHNERQNSDKLSIGDILCNFRNRWFVRWNKPPPMLISGELTSALMSLNLVMKACLTTSTVNSEASTMTTSGNNTHRWSENIKCVKVILNITLDISFQLIFALPAFHENCSMFRRHTMSRRMQLVNLSLMSVGNKWINPGLTYFLLPMTPFHKCIFY